MDTRRIDGTAVARALRTQLRDRVGALAARGVVPGLHVILVGNDPASSVYVRMKTKACEELGIASRQWDLPAQTSAAELLSLIAELNRDSKVHGILVQLPLPKQIATQQVLATIAPEKDVDGFHVMSAGALMIGEPSFVPCTPAGVMHLLRESGVPIAGQHAVIVGRSNIVGKPLAMLLLQADATVTICHSKTAALADLTRQADILIAAIGRPNFITRDMVKPGAVVIDVGINRLPDGKLAGDCDWTGLQGIASQMTPVPGGVGPMTIAKLLENTILSAERTLTA